MKKTWVKKVLCLVAVVAILFTMAGCGTQNKTDDDGKIHITIGGMPSERTEANAKTYDWFQETAAKFTEKYPNIVVEAESWDYDVKTFLAKAAANNLPTVFSCSVTELKHIIEGGYAEDVTKLVKEYGYDEAFNKEQYGEMYMHGDKYYALVKPSSVYNMGMSYNVDLFKKAGLVDENGVPQFPQTWDEVVETGKIIKEKTGKAGFALHTNGTQGGWAFLNILWAFGADTMEFENGKWVAKFASEEGIAALQFVKDMKWKHDILQPELLASAVEIARILGSGGAAMAMDNLWCINYAAEKNGMDIKNGAMSKMPAGPAGRYAMTGGFTYIFTGTEEENDACFKWLEFIGNGKTISDEMRDQWRKTYELEASKNHAVGVRTSNIWKDEDRLAEEDKIMQEFANVDVKLYEDYTKGEGITYMFEPERCVQQMYSVLSSAIQEVLVNKDADCAEVMKKAQNDFQVTYLDKETN